MWTDAAEGKENTQAFVPIIEHRAAPLLEEITAAYELQAKQRGFPASDVRLTDAERGAAALVVERVEGATRSRRRRSGDGPSLPDEFNAEFRLLLSKSLTVLEMRDFLSGEFTPLPLMNLMAVLRAQEKAGAIRLVKR